MCRWDLSPAILLLFPADWDCKSPPTVTPPWGELAHGFGSSKPDRQWPGQAPREPRSQNADWGKKRQKEKELKCWCFMVCSQRSPSAGRGECSPRSSARWGELSPLSFSLFLVEHLESPPSLGYAFKGYWKSTYLGQELGLSSMAMVVGVSEWVSRDREYLRIRDTPTPVWSRRSLLRYQHISPKERQENHLRNWRSHLGYPTKSA